MLAYVVTIKNAAKPDKDGLLQPLLRRWQAGGCSYAVFSLPAVQASCRPQRACRAQHGMGCRSWGKELASTGNPALDESADLP